MRSRKSRTAGVPQPHRLHSGPRLALNRAYAVMFVVAMLALIGTGAYSLIDNILQGGASDAPFALQRQIDAAHSAEKVTATVSIHNLDLANRLMSGALTVSAPPSPKPADLWAYSAGNIYLFDLTFTSSGTPDYFVERPILAKKLLPPSTTTLNQVSVPLNVPVPDLSSLYPDDTYHLIIRLDLGLTAAAPPVQCKKGQTCSSVGAPLAQASTEALPFFFNAGPLYESRSVGYKSTLEGGDRVLDITMSRPIQTRTFVYAVSVIPLLFALLFFHLLFVSKTYGDTGLQDFLIAIVGAILAILPLRLILVPADVVGLTRVDFMLGAGLIAIVCVALAKYVTEMWNDGAGSMEESHNGSRDSGHGVPGDTQPEGS